MTRKTVLILEDELLTSRLMKKYFEARGFSVIQAFDLAAAYQKSTLYSLDIAIVDINLPSGSSLDQLRELKKMLDCPIILCTSDNQSSTEIHGLALGAEDYVAKDRGVDVLYYRVNNILEKFSPLPKESSQNIIDVGKEIFLHQHSNTLVYGEILLNLTPKETSILVHLSKNMPYSVSKEVLSWTLNGYEYDGHSRSLDLIVCRLRKKLKVSGINLRIETIRGKGYSIRHSNN